MRALYTGGDRRKQNQTGPTRPSKSRKSPPKKESKTGRKEQPLPTPTPNPTPHQASQQLARQREAQLQQVTAQSRTLQQQLQLLQSQRGDSQRAGAPPAGGVTSGAPAVAGGDNQWTAATSGVIAAAGAAERVVRIV